MFTANIDLGQVLMSVLIGAIGYFVKRTVERVESRVDKVEGTIFDLNSNLQLVIGKLEVERRGTRREH